ncbi:MAG: CHAT domain-containing tetratricopeptide repeat protein, partial [Bacteroidota bacterium]
MGNVYFEALQFKEAQELYEKSHTILKNTFGESHPNVAKSYGHIGMAYLGEKNYLGALPNFHQSIRIAKRLFGEIHTDVAHSYNNIGDTKKALRNYEEAIENYQKSLKIRQAIWGEHHPETIQCYLKLMDVSYEKNDLAKALEYCQKSLQANVPSFASNSFYENPPLDDYIDGNFLLEAMRKRGRILKQLYLKNKDTKDLIHAYETFKQCDHLIGQIRHSYKRYGDKVALGNVAYEVYAEAIAVCQLSYNTSRDTKYLKQAFYFSEKSKAVVLHEKLSGEQAKKYAGIPESLLKLEKSLKTDWSFYYSKVQGFENQTTAEYDSTATEHYKNALFQTETRLDSLKGIFEEQYTNYYELKYEEDTITTEALQDNLRDHQALLSCFEGDSTLHVFAVSKTNFDLITIKKDEAFDKITSAYISSLDPTKVTNQSEEDYHQFTTNAYGLYQQLLAPVMPSIPPSVESLIIIPDGKLSYVPWDVLLQSTPDTSKDLSYSNLDYLFNDYAISYAYSANILFDGFHAKKTTSKNRVLAFAPTYQPAPESADSYATLEESFRDAVVPLKWNKSEINGIAKHFSGSFLSGEMATEKAFKEEAGKYQVLHLAMHALVDDRNSMRSKLVFTPGVDSTEDDMLHTYELFNMDLNAELTVLSACNTGLGELQKGEGVMSLGRAFAYAGCPSIVMSHWSAPDESTSKLMTFFYEALAAGKRKDVAMQDARKAFLKQRGLVKEHPLYWCGFVVWGDTSPLTRKSGALHYWLTLAGALIVGIGLISVLMWHRRKKTANSLSRH